MREKQCSIAILCALIATAAFSGAVIAAEDAFDRDPFFSDKPRPAGTARPAPGGEAAWGGRDPFVRPFDDRAPARSASTREAGRRLTGIIYSEANRIAIIDGEAVREGGTIGDLKLITIKSRSVVLAGASGVREELFLEDFSLGQ
ncbi:MAG TPA: hypothetical protein VK654_15655 [Nitrospirota bacterium]|nr:hypothetical protein [Nitrospirota bacterium]